MPTYSLLDNSPNTGWANSELSENLTYFIVDFIDKQIYLDSYQLQLSCNPPNEIKVEGSNDGINWYEIDNNLTTFESYKSIVFYTKIKKFFKMIKIRQIGKSQSNHFRFVLTGIEFYGSLRSNINNHNLYLSRKTNLNCFSVFIYIFVLISSKS